MSPFLRIPLRLRTPASIPLGRNSSNVFGQQAYVHDTAQKFSSANEHNLEEECDRGNTPNHPIPSNKAHPTLRDGRQSNLADISGVKHEDLPEDRLTFIKDS
ncbi:unnamed protein product [Penicillium manginii]